jgi:hypothetical protein
MKELIFKIVFLLNAVFCAFSQEDYKIDWTRGRIFSSAFSVVKNDYNFALNRIEAMDQIHEKAKANFVRVLKKININESLSVSDYFEQRSGKNQEL